MRKLLNVIRTLRRENSFFIHHNKDLLEENRDLKELATTQREAIKLLKDTVKTLERRVEQEETLGALRLEITNLQIESYNLDGAFHRLFNKCPLGGK